MAKPNKKTIFLAIFLIAVPFAFLMAAPAGFAGSTAICRYDLPDAANKDTIFCPTDTISEVASIECGNGALDAGEELEDGNILPGDGCSATCTTEYICGNELIEPGEQCDDGNNVETDGCLANCMYPLQPGDILSVQITKRTNRDGTDTTLFSRADTMTVEATVTNYSAGQITGDTVFSLAIPENAAVGTPIDTKIINDTYPPGPSARNYDFDWATTTPQTAANGTYFVKVGVPILHGEEICRSGNNSDTYYITLGEAVNKNVSVPETNLLFVPIIGFAVMAIIYYSSMAK